MFVFQTMTFSLEKLQLAQTMMEEDLDEEINFKRFFYT